MNHEDCDRRVMLAAEERSRLQGIVDAIRENPVRALNLLTTGCSLEGCERTFHELHPRVIYSNLIFHESCWDEFQGKALDE